MPDLLYGSVAFSPGLTQAQTDRLQVAQNRGARAVYGRPGFSRASDLLERMQVFKDWRSNSAEGLGLCLEVHTRQCESIPPGALRTLRGS